MGAVPDNRFQGWVVAGRRTLVRRGDRGAAAVEFALVAPLLLLLVFGIIQYGYMLSFRQAISQGAADGARAAAIAPAGQVNALRVGDAYERLSDALGSYGVRCDSGTLKRGSATVGSCAAGIAACPAPDAGDDCVTVTVSYDYKGSPLLPPLGLGIAMPDTLEYAAVAEVS